jgi:uncharacterized membrane protein YccC
MFNKIFNLFAVVLFCLQLFISGANFADNSVADGVVNLVLAAFWGSILLINVWGLSRRANLSDRLEDLMAEAFVHINRQIRQDHQAMHASAEGAKNAKQKATKSKGNSSNAGTTPKSASGTSRARKATGRSNAQSDKPVRPGSKRKS